jgi:hypothetical protein
MRAMRRTDDLVRRFHEAMLGVYQRVSAACPGYGPTYFLRMVTERRGLDAARALLATRSRPWPSSGGFRESRCRADGSLDSIPSCGKIDCFAGWHLIVEQEVAGVGYAKDQWLREMEQGYSTIRPDKAVCDECFADEAIQQFVRNGADETKCSYCGRESDEPIAVSATVPLAPPVEAAMIDDLDLADLRGQAHAKRALEIAAAEAHNLLLVGPPGGG